MVSVKTVSECACFFARVLLPCMWDCPGGRVSVVYVSQFCFCGEGGACLVCC